MIKSVFFIVTVLGMVTDWAGPVSGGMDECIAKAHYIQQLVVISVKQHGPDSLTGPDGNPVAIQDLKLGCYLVTEIPVVGEPIHGKN